MFPGFCCTLIYYPISSFLPAADSETYTANTKFNMMHTDCQTFLFAILRPPWRPFKPPVDPHEGRIKVNMWAHNQPVLFCSLIPQPIQHPQKIRTLLPDLCKQYQCHTLQVFLWSFQTSLCCCLRVLSPVSEADQSADSEQCLQIHKCPKRPCVIEAGDAQIKECDHVIKMTIKQQKPLKFHILFIFSLGALLVGFYKLFFFFFGFAVQVYILQNNLLHSNCWFFVLDLTEIWGFLCFFLYIIVFLLHITPHLQCLQPTQPVMICISCIPHKMSLCSSFHGVVHCWVFQRGQTRIFSFRFS